MGWGLTGVLRCSPHGNWPDIHSEVVRGRRVRRISAEPSGTNLGINSATAPDSASMKAVDALFAKVDQISTPKSAAAARFLVTRFAFYLLALYLRIVQSCLYLFGFGWSSVERCLQYASALADERPLPKADTPERIRIVERAGRRFLALGEEEVVVVGGNYVLKHYPWFPSPEDVEEDCALVCANLAKSNFQVQGKRVVPCWRLGCLWSGAMPTPGVLDPSWVAKLHETVAIFAKHGIYCFLEVHQDAMCSTNGGEGVPHWVAQHFQAHPEYLGASYLVSPSHPLAIALPEWLRPLWSRFLTIQTAPGDEDPWHAFSVDDQAPGRDPSLMNIGNPSIRLNNCACACAPDSARERPNHISRPPRPLSFDTARGVQAC